MVDLGEGFLIFAVLAVFAISVTALLVFWPRGPTVLLTRERKQVRILDIVELSKDTKRFRIDTGGNGSTLGLPVGKHMVIYAPNPDKCMKTGQWNGKSDTDKRTKEIDRKYTPVTGKEVTGYFDVVIKMYRPGKFKMADGQETTWEDGGKMTAYLDSKQPGDHIDINGPIGINEYLGRGMFKLPGQTVSVKHVGMLAGGSGITPMLQIINASLSDTKDRTNFYLIYANKTEDDILCKDLLEDAASRSKGRFKITYTLDFPPAGWKGEAGFITPAMIRERLPKPGKETFILMCGPPPMIEHACKKNLDVLGYKKESMVTF